MRILIHDMEVYIKNVCVLSCSQVYTSSSLLLSICISTTFFLPSILLLFHVTNYTVDRCLFGIQV